MKEKRGLFETIFGRRPQRTEGYTTYKLLSSSNTGFVPFSGNSWNMNVVRASIHAFAKRAASVQPQHIRWSDGRVMTPNDGSYNYILQVRPNPMTTAYKFYYSIAMQYKLYNNAFVLPIFDEASGKLSALYNIRADRIDLLEKGGELFCRFVFFNGKTYIYPYADMIHIGTMFGENDVFGSNNEALLPVLQTANTFNQSMSKFAELVAVVRGILRVHGSPKREDLSSRRDDFIKDNLRVDSNGAGIIVSDDKYDYQELNSKSTPLPAGQLAYIKNEIYDYFGTNEAIVQNKATSEQELAFYDAEIEPFFMQLQQAFNDCLFSKKERGFGNQIFVTINRLKFTTTGDKLKSVKFLAEIGAATMDQALTTLGYPPIGGEEGGRRIQTLNVVNANIADEYQLGSKDLTEPTEGEDENVLQTE